MRLYQTAATGDDILWLNFIYAVYWSDEYCDSYGCEKLTTHCRRQRAALSPPNIQAPASLRATPNASLQATSRNHTLLTLWTLPLGNTDFITLGNTANIVLIILTWLSNLGFGSGEGSFYLHHYLTQPFRVWFGGVILLTSLLDAAI